MFFKKILILTLLGLSQLCLVKPGALAQTDSLPGLSFDLGFTRGRNINLWPVFKRQVGADSREVDVLFPLYRSAKDFRTGRHDRRLLPFFIHSASPLEQDTRVGSAYYPSLTRFVRDSTGKKAFRFMEMAPGLSLFDLTRTREGLTVENNLLFFVWWKRQPERDFTRLIVFPFSWYYQAPGRGSYTFFPLYSQGLRGSHHYRAFTPLFWTFRNPSFQRSVFIPFAWYYRELTGSDPVTRRTFLPVYFSQTSKSYASHLILPAWFSYRNPFYASTTLFPLYSEGTSPRGTEKHLAITPLYWKFQNPAQRVEGLIPLWYRHLRYGEDTTRFSTVAPLFFAWKGRQTSSMAVLPFYWQRMGPDYVSHNLFPLFFAGRNTSRQKDHLGLTPFFWRFRSPGQRLVALFPIGYHFSSDSPTDSLRYTLVLPLWWSARSANFSQTLVVPLFWRTREGARDNLALVPFYARYSRLNGLYSTQMFSPFVWKTRAPNETTWSAFLLWNHRSTLHDGQWNTQSSLFPLWFAGKKPDSRYQVLFPVLFRLKNQDFRSLTLLPLYHRSLSADSAVFRQWLTPFYYSYHTPHSDGKLALLLYFQRRLYAGQDTIARRVVFPIYWGLRSANRNQDFLLPVFMRNENLAGRSLVLFPVFARWDSRSGAERYFAVTPLFWRFDRENRRVTSFIPLWWERHLYYSLDTIHSQVLFPVWWSRTSRTTRLKTLFPLVWSAGNAWQETFSIIPLYYSRVRKESNTHTLAITPLFWHREHGGHRFSTLFPLYWRTRSPGPDSTRWDVLFPLIWLKANQQSNQQVLFPILWRKHSGQEFSFRVFPIFWMRKIPEINFSDWGISLLFRNLRAGDFRVISVATLYRYTRFSTPKGPATRQVLFPLWFNLNRPGQSHQVLFPVFWKYRLNLDRHLALFPLFYKGQFAQNQTRLLALTPLFWQKTDSLRNRTVLFPIYWSSTEEARKSRLLLPFLYYRKTPDQRSFLLFPVVFSQQKPQAHQLAITPFFLHSEKAGKSYSHLLPVWFSGHHNDKHVSVFFPVYWDSRRTGHRTRIVFPIWWKNHHTLNGITTSSLTCIPLYREKDAGLWGHRVVFPLYWSFRSPQRRTNILFPFYAGSVSADSAFAFRAITPFFWSISDRGVENRFLIPVFSKTTGLDFRSFDLFYFVFRSSRLPGYHKWQALWPFIESIHSPDFRTFRIAPVLWYKRDKDYHHFSIQPLFFQSRSDSAYRLMCLWQVFGITRSPSLDYSWNILWKTVYWNRFRNGDHEFRFLYLLFAHANRDGERVNSFFPFYYASEKANGEKNTSVLVFLYNRFRQAIPGSAIFYEEERLFWFFRLRSNFRQLEAKGLTKDLKRRRW